MPTAIVEASVSDPVLYSTGFENNNHGWIAVGSGGSVERVAYESRSGDRSLRWQSGSDTDAKVTTSMPMTVPVEGGRVSFWYKRTEGDAVLRARMVNDADGDLGISFARTLSTATGEWVELTWNFSTDVPVTGPYEWRLEIYKAGGSDDVTLFIDDILVTRSFAGNIGAVDSTYSNIQSGSALTMGANPGFQVGQAESSAYFVWQTFLEFDIPRLPEDAQITSVGFTITKRVDESFPIDRQFDVVALGYDFTSPIVDASQWLTGTDAANATVLGSVTIPTESAPTGERTFQLTVTQALRDAIDPNGGTLKIVLVSSRYIDNDPPDNGTFERVFLDPPQLQIEYTVIPSPARIHRALVTSPVRMDWRFERVSKTGQFLEDVSSAFLWKQCAVDLNNDRDVTRTAQFRLRGDQEMVDPLSDHIRVISHLTIEGQWEAEFPFGLFALNIPRREFRPNGLEEWDVAAADLSLHLVSSTTTATYVVEAGENYITGTNAVASIFDAHGLRHAFPHTTKTLPADMTWPVGTPWIRVVNDLLKAAGFYTHWFDAEGIARSRPTEDSLDSRTPDIEYTYGDGFVLSPFTDEVEMTRFANRIIVVSDNPDIDPPIVAVATNADPDSPTSTVRLGRTIVKEIRRDAADQSTAAAIAQHELELASSYYRRATLDTAPDPRREAREVYALNGEKWWVRNWQVSLAPGSRMQHTIARVEKVS